MIKIFKAVCLFIIFFFFCGGFFVSDINSENKELSSEASELSSLFSLFVYASGEASHIVISEVQIGGESVYDEFVELYNPMDSAIDLENWDLKRKTKSGSENNILNNIEGTIPPHGYFLIVPRANCGENKNEACYTKEIAADDEYTTNSFLAKNNTVLLYNNDGDLIDKVGWGEASDFEGEIISVNPEDGESLGRKGGDDTTQDADNNNDDFVLLTDPNPQNSFVAANNDDNNNDNDDNNNNDNDNNNNNDNQDDLQDDSEQENEINTSSYKIVITEFLPNPEDSDRDNEFIEIYNAGETNANLKEWTLEDKMGKVKIFEVLERVEIKPGGYKVFYSDETKITLNNSGDGVVLRNNEGDIISETPVSDSAKEDQAYALDKNGNWGWTLRPTAGRKNIIKEEKKASDIKQDKHTPSPSQEENRDSDDGQDDSTALRDYEYEINDNVNDNDNSNDKLEKSVEYNFSDEVVISEIYPNPKGRDNRDSNYEWIELYNCSSRDVDLIGWQIDDILRKGSKPYTIKKSKIIKANGHLVLTNEEIKVIFNNSGDEVNLLWPDGTVVDSAQYGKSIEGQSYGWVGGSWAWSRIVTPGKDNKMATSLAGRVLKTERVVNLDNEIEAETDESDPDIEENLTSGVEYIKSTIAEAKELAKFSDVRVSGIVSTPPGIFSDNIFYIAGSGIQVYSKNADIFEINIGDEIEIAGRISEVGGEKRILLNGMESIKVISRDNLVESKIISTTDVGEAVEGSLVTVEGEVVEIKNDVFFLNDGSGKVKIYIKPQTGIENPKIETGDWMVITGQVSRTSVGYRILPRFQADLRISRVSGVSVSSTVLTEQEGDSVNGKKNKKEAFILKNANSVIYAIIVLTGVLILFNWGKIKITKSCKITKP